MRIWATNIGSVVQVCISYIDLFHRNQAITVDMTFVLVTIVPQKYSVLCLLIRFYQHQSCFEELTTNFSLESFVLMTTVTISINLIRLWSQFWPKKKWSLTLVQIKLVFLLILSYCWWFTPLVLFWGIVTNWSWGCAQAMMGFRQHPCVEERQKVCKKIYSCTNPPLF